MVKVRGWFGYGRRTNLQALVEAARRYLDGVQPADGIIEIDATADELFAAMDALQELAEGARSGSALLDDGQGVRVRVGPPGLSTVWGAEPSPAGARRVGSIEGVCPDLIDALAFAPDARSLAIGCCGGWSATALVWDLRRGAPSQALVARDEEDTQFASARRWLSFLGEHLITAGRDSVVRCWDPATGHLLRQRSFRARIEASAAAPDGSGIAVQLEGGSSIQLLDEALKPCGEVYTSPAVALAYGRSGHLLVQARRALDVVSPGREIQTYFGTFQDSVLLPDGRVIAVESRDGGSRLVVLSPGERTELDLARPRALGISPGGQHLVALCHDEVVVLEVASQRRVHHLELPSSVWLGAVVAIDDGGIVALAQGRRLVLWHTAAAAPILEPDPELVQLDRRGRRMLIQHRDGDGEKVIAWRAVDDPGVGGLLEGVPRSIELSMDGRILIQHGDPEDEGERWVSYTELDSGASLGKI
ncbi:MAG TPA: hypothetical protein ENK18_26775, partial [Deltaproteobacteria bacterium]|nr:hypothetical protein [Deltaproteobacteria bacterium]